MITQPDIPAKPEHIFKMPNSNPTIGLTFNVVGVENLIIKLKIIRIIPEIRSSFRTRFIKFLIISPSNQSQYNPFSLL
jgi:hypothetical protein